MEPLVTLLPLVMVSPLKVVVPVKLLVALTSRVSSMVVAPCRVVLLVTSRVLSRPVSAVRLVTLRVVMAARSLRASSSARKAAWSCERALATLVTMRLRVKPPTANSRNNIARPAQRRRRERGGFGGLTCPKGKVGWTTLPVLGQLLSGMEATIYFHNLKQYTITNKAMIEIVNTKLIQIKRLFMYLKMTLLLLFIYKNEVIICIYTVHLYRFLSKFINFVVKSVTNSLSEESLSTGSLYTLCIIPRA